MDGISGDYIGPRGDLVGVSNGNVVVEWGMQISYGGGLHVDFNRGKLGGTLIYTGGDWWVFGWEGGFCVSPNLIETVTHAGSFKLSLGFLFTEKFLYRGYGAP